ncbi:MAG: glycosyltransferase family 39 protein [Acidobacteria bacterium]|nr:glycosyltransferase family 39 protein [Acidobacteriota bacterium]
MSAATLPAKKGTGQGNLLRWLILGAGAAGAGVRLAAYLANRSFWCDESMLAFNVMDRAWSGLLEPLSLSQAAPFGFLVVTKVFCSVLGYSEGAFRFLPLIGGLVSLPLMYLLGKKAAGPWTGLLGLILLGVNGPAVFHATEFKPYSTDLMFTLSVTLVFLEWFRRELDHRYLWILGPVTAAAVWISFPSIFVITGAAAAVLLVAGRRGQWRNLATGGLVLLWTAVHFGLHSGLVLPRTVNNAYLQHYWEGAFLPLDSLAVLAGWLWRAGGDLMTENLLFYWPLIPALLAAVGGWWCIRRCPLLALLIGVTCLLTLGASALQLYPFGGYGGRTIHFVIPLILLLIARAGTWAAEFNGPWLMRALGVGVLLAALLGGPLAQLPAFITAPPGFTEELRPVLEYVTAQARPGDTVYFYWKTHFQMAYYHHWYDFRHVQVVRGVPLRDPERDTAAFRRQLDELRVYDRVWLIFSNWGRADHPEQDMVADYLNRHGRVLKRKLETGAAAMLFAFEVNPRTPDMPPRGSHE